MGAAEEFAATGLGMITDVGNKAIDFGFGQLSANQANQAAKEMYRKRWRWAVSDMRQAGINPLLLTKSGPGASPSAALGAVGGPTMLGASAERLARGASERARSTRVGSLMDEQKQNIAWDTALKQSAVKYNNARSALEWKRYEISQIERAVAEAMLPSAVAEAEYNRWYYGEGARQMRDVLGPVAPYVVPLLRGLVGK